MNLKQISYEINPDPDYFPGFPVDFDWDSVALRFNEALSSVFDCEIRFEGCNPLLRTSFSFNCEYDEIDELEESYREDLTTNLEIRELWQHFEVIDRFSLS